MSYETEDIDMYTQPHANEDAVMAPPPKAANNDDAEDDDEGEGDDLRPNAKVSDDSSEEEEEDEEAERRVREGFIVDEDDDDEEGEDDEEERRRRKKRKHKHKRKHQKREEEDEDLDEDDLDLLQENTGGRVARSKLTRLRRGRGSDDEGVSGSSRRKAVDDSSDSGIDEANIIGARSTTIQDIQNIWDDDRAGGRDDDDDMDMDDFIADEDEEDEGAGAMAEEEREERRRERRRLAQERREMMKGRPELTGIDASAWDEIHDVFGDGHDYDWALVDDEEEAMDRDKEVTKFADVFEPSEIKARMLTEDDDLVRARDVPERMQLSTSTLSPNQTVDWFEPLSVQECQDAASWITPKLGSDKEQNFFRTNGVNYRLLSELVEAVTHVLEFLFINNYEVPYIWTHRRDFLVESEIKSNRAQLLSLDELWLIYQLGLRYRSLCLRRRKLERTYRNLGVHDEYFEAQILPAVDTMESVIDSTQWLTLKHKAGKNVSFELTFYGDENTEKTKAPKRPSRNNAYDLAKNSIVSKVVEGYGIKSHEIVENFSSLQGSQVNPVSDMDLPPLAFAEQFQDPDPLKAQSPENILKQARLILATELGMDPLLRKAVRDHFRYNAVVSCLPTERGKSISRQTLEYSYKYLKDKPVKEIAKTPLYLMMLKTEEKGLISIKISLPADTRERIITQIMNAFQTESFSEAAQAWNDERRSVVEEAVDNFFVPMGTRWVREYLREECEDVVAKRLYEVTVNRIDRAPYRPPSLNDDEVPSVLAASWGRGDPKKDEISLVYLDEFGRMREHTLLDNLTDIKNITDFRELVKRRKPDVIVVGGYNILTTKLSAGIKNALHPKRIAETKIRDENWLQEFHSAIDLDEVDPAFEVPVIYMYDQIAKVYQNTKRAAAEFPEFSTISRYCVALARYTQSPVNELAAMGSDVSAVLLDEVAKLYLPLEKYYSAVERALINVVNKVGIDINRAVNEPYYALMLPFVSGLGPRKAQALIKRVIALGGTLVNREHFIKQNILTTSIFINASGFLRIVHDGDYKDPKSRAGPNGDYSDSADPLDNTRIHSEDFDLARKMACDALELDEEDVADEHPSAVVAQLMKDPDIDRRLKELSMDDFASSLRLERSENKRETLDLVREELRNPFGELRQEFLVPDAEDVWYMLTSLRKFDLNEGYNISGTIIRTTPNELILKLPIQELEGYVDKKYLAEEEEMPLEKIPLDMYKKNTVLPVHVMSIRKDLANDDFCVELNGRPSDATSDDSDRRTIRHEIHWDFDAEQRDDEVARRRKFAENNSARRVIKHPNFHNLNSSKAEAYLEDQHPGDVVIRPSSKGLNHLAVTWKVADKLYQHIDVTDKNAGVDDQQVGNQLIVDDKYEFSDLDELIVNHIKAMSRRVEELMAHEKFKRDEDELHKFLTSFVAANPNKSIYGFTLNRKRPGHFHLCFLARKHSSIQTWPVRVAPEAYYLFDAAAAGVSELCDAFKVRYLHESQNASAMGSGGGGKTPFGAGRGMTPGRTPARTPAHMSMRPPAGGKTPLAGHAFGPPSGTPLSTTSYSASTTYGGPNTYGFQTPRAGGFTPAGFTPAAASGPPPGMNPARASMIQQSGGWVNGGGGSGWGN